MIKEQHSIINSSQKAKNNLIFYIFFQFAN